MGVYVFLVSFYNLSSVSNSKPSSYQDSNSSLVTIMFLRLRLAAAWLYIAIYSLRTTGINHMEQHPWSRRCTGSQPVRPPNFSHYILRLLSLESPGLPRWAQWGWLQGSHCQTASWGCSRNAIWQSSGEGSVLDCAPQEGTTGRDIRRCFVVVSWGLYWAAVLKGNAHQAFSTPWEGSQGLNLQVVGVLRIPCTRVLGICLHLMGGSWLKRQLTAWCEERFSAPWGSKHLMIGHHTFPPVITAQRCSMQWWTAWKAPLNLLGPGLPNTTVCCCKSLWSSRSSVRTQSPWRRDTQRHLGGWVGQALLSQSEPAVRGLCWFHALMTVLYWWQGLLWH